MNIALPILLLVFCGLTFWVLSESQLKWYFKTALISSFCIFTIMFYSLIHTFLGWGAEQADMPDKVAIHWVIVKEPNKLKNFDGKIYILLESVEDTSGAFSKFFGYKRSKIEPRLFEMEYSRELHEELAKRVIPRNKKGQPVAGKFLKGGTMGKKGLGKNEKKGGGSESQEQEWHFHELLPSEVQGKPE